MKSKGFTLIELLAVIVILAIIALIATPIILGIINNAKKESQERSVELYATAVKNGIALSQLNTGTSVKAGKYTSSTLPFEVSYDGDVECATIEIYEDGTIYVDECTVNQEMVDYAYGKNKTSGKACTLDDKDGDGKASLSDVVTCGTESFYVMTNENNEITMLSMYNLDVGNVVTYDENLKSTITPIENPTNKQNELAMGFVSFESIGYGLLVFDDKFYWESVENYPEYVYNENADIYPYVSEYERILTEEIKVKSAKTSLIRYEQLVKLGCDEEKQSCGPDWSVDEYALIENPAPEWVYSTSYWTGSAQDFVNMFLVQLDGAFGTTEANWIYSCGVRPVVTISTSEI